MSKVSEAVQAKRNQEKGFDYKKQYTDHFNSVGADAAESAQLIKNYESATKGLDQAQAFQALEGGKGFDLKGGDKQRYDAISQAKERGQTYSANSPGNNTNSSQSPGNSTDVHQAQNQNANQDNDINTTINGNDNTVTNNVDNSIRQYGGVNKSFTYNGSSNGNNYEDTPVSAGTIGGYFYDEDSPGKSAAFVDRYQTMNSDYQKKFENKGRAQDAINKADANQTINIDNLDQRIEARTKANRARSTVMAGEIFGDMFNFSPDKFEGPEAQDPVKSPDFKKLGKI